MATCHAAFWELGFTKIFMKQNDGSFLSPRGDYSILEEMDDRYERTLKDGTQVYF